ncbi:acyl carrier protein [Actinomadura roseirufa]|uniref:acyl carrier protein n=1 Tax=Actinomadura roseirufa TaxID=2094049 RepID=UPI001041BB2B|nr:acyl carrier protein [Actinomadura roseirufa]
MPSEEIVEQIGKLIRTLMPDLEADITADTTFEELGMDSLGRVDLFTDAEATFGVVVPDEELATILGVRDLAEFLTERTS